LIFKTKSKDRSLRQRLQRAGLMRRVIAANMPTARRKTFFTCQI
jgi:hypothetical protein